MIRTTVLALGASIASATNALAGAPAPDGAVPVYCYTGVGVGGEGIATCRRADTRAVVTPVPVGQFLFITDVVVEPNNASTTGTFSGLVGVDDADGFPRDPSVDILGSPTRRLHFAATHIVLRAGESLAAANLSGSAFPIDVRASGFLATAFAAPLPDDLFRNGFEP